MLRTPGIILNWCIFILLVFCNLFIPLLDSYYPQLLQGPKMGPLFTAIQQACSIDMSNRVTQGPCLAYVSPHRPRSCWLREGPLHAPIITAVCVALPWRPVRLGTARGLRPK
jgi:hypothetical protein